MARIKTSCYLTQGDYADVSFGNSTVAQIGCGVCTLAMHLLNKVSDEMTDSLKKSVVKAVANSSLFTDGSMCWPPKSTTFKINNKYYSIGYKKTIDIAAEVINGNTGFVHFTASDGTHTASHFVLVDGIYSNESDPLKKLLVVDPSYGDSRTLYEAMATNYDYNELQNITPSTAHLNANLKCVFD